MSTVSFPKTVDFQRGELLILDQTRLPAEEVVVRLTTVEQTREAIASLRVRGAPAIGIAAAFGLCLAAQASAADTLEALRADLAAARDTLASSRPTAVNLFWALGEVMSALEGFAGTAGEARAALLDRAHRLAGEDEAVCRAIGRSGLPLLRNKMGILTHCNAGSLAAVRYGTALAPVYCALENGINVRMYADETRPLLQGARLTAWELMRAGVDVTLLCDNMAASLMASGAVDACFVGCDRVAANGDTANKIGTSGVAILAAHFGVPFYVCAPLSTVDLNTPSGRDIVIERRAPGEVTELWYTSRMAPEGVAVYNPAFDVTDASLITAFVTEAGLVYPPFGEKLRALKE